MQIFMRCLTNFFSNSVIFSGGESYNCYYCNVVSGILLLIHSRENFSLLNVIKSRHSKTCLP
ncbi:hypothetical protein T02_7618 [Trichinella nativa]|uniref:Uncharacterized protein n=1 Tax=Trichinella nativa TaxID=6335 RepID=A0A0V1KMJ4_9BILA|nr:hypothetical protein T02_7618 [Trichinella nativa]